MKFEVTHVSRGDILLKSADKLVRVLDKALIASTQTEPSHVIYLNSLNYWEIPPEITLTETEKQEVVSAVRKHFQDRGSFVDFE